MLLLLLLSSFVDNHSKENLCGKFWKPFSFEIYRFGFGFGVLVKKKLCHSIKIINIMGFSALFHYKHMINKVLKMPKGCSACKKERILGKRHIFILYYMKNVNLVNVHIFYSSLLVYKKKEACSNNKIEKMCVSILLKDYLVPFFT